jgi:Domain of unknown function (DUF1942)
MKVTKLAAPLGVAAVAIGIVAAAPPASAISNIKPFGQQERLNDAAGNPMIGYTVKDLVKSSDPVPHNGQLYAATLVVDSTGVWAYPMVGMFNARSQGGDNYRVIANAGPDAAPPGGSSTGTLYFDVVGPEPNSVVYNDGVQDLLGWIPGPFEGGNRP